MSINEAKKVLQDSQLELELKENSEDNSNEEKRITQQLPKAGIKIKQGTSVIAYQN